MTVKEASAAERAIMSIRIELARQRISASSLARRIGMSNSALARRMSGELPLRLDELDLIAATLGVPATSLLGNGQI